MSRRRKISGLLLLAVFLPALLVSSFHHHEPRPAACEACVEHLPHDGHLTSDTHVGECLICQFAGVPFLLATALTAGCFRPLGLGQALLPPPAVTPGHLARPSDRAPPVRV